MRKFIINVNGNSYEVEVEEVKGETKKESPKAKPAVAPKETAVQKEVVVSQGQEIVQAPMPGNIWRMEVEEGQEVKEGDLLLILEAMKMENEILAPRAGKIVEIIASEGASVGTGEKLMIIE